MFDLALRLVRVLEVARGPREYLALPHWFGYIDNVRYGLVRLFRLPVVAELDHLGLPKQGWDWCANQRLTGNTMYIEAALTPPPMAGLRSLLQLAADSGASRLTLDRLRHGHVYSREYNLEVILKRFEHPKGEGAKRRTQDVQADRILSLEGISSNS